MSRGLREDRREGEVLARWIAGLFPLSRAHVALARLASNDRPVCLRGGGAVLRFDLVFGLQAAVL